MSICSSCRITPKEKWVVAACPVFDVASQGNDEAQARANLMEAMTLYFESCLERGILDQILKNCALTLQEVRGYLDR